MSIHKGLLTPYLVNRLLTEQEKRNQLHQGQPHSEHPLVYEDDTVIKMNSTYLETVDRHYSVKGYPSLFSFVLFVTILVITIYGCSVTFDRYFFQHNPLNSKRIFAMSIALICIFFSLCFLSKIFLKEWFRKTHYPIRFNRKNQMVYVYQVDGTVLSASWKKVFFTPYEGKLGIPGWGIDGHILADDQETVLRTFSLGFYGDKDDMIGYWEFIRCYMEEDVLDDLSKTIFICPPIAEKKESYLFGLQYSFRFASKLEWYQLLFLPYTLLECLSRYIAMQTSKIPQWPEEIEISCKVASDDKIDVSYKNNIQCLWRYTLANLKTEDYIMLHKQRKTAAKRIKRKVIARVIGKY
ncbi:DUF6708 domain-containing protein [Xenorhabdus szentirmaii]|uniref:DUF6708 domain-containing protein n=1 Tax=Xenorhabdus szentirmaii TaxID=290112 RepID=UPI00198F483D|nr:DUF6708 domain-containing protein [Xenorhabdus sp. 38]MBD2781657.1 hypothetical protein [Xenorhabdus sp. 38]